MTDKPGLIIGVDPAMEASGFAFRETGGRVCYGVVNGIENLGCGNATKVALAHQPSDKCPVYLLIEYPTWSGHGAEQVRAAANCWIRVLKAAFPRRLKVMKVTPPTWMARMIPGWKDVARPADLYVPLAHFLGEVPGPRMDENAAAALVLMSMAEGLVASGKFGEDLRVTPVKRKKAVKK